MSVTPRPYQQEAIDTNVEFFKDERIYHGLEVLPTAAGKSVVVANTAMNLDGNTLILQPSKEILIQNFNKYIGYGYRASIYSASLKQKHVDKVTFATIGSIYKKAYLFKEFKNIIVDECHTINPMQGIYRDFIKSISGAKVLGLTATPFRLVSATEGPMLEFLTNSRPRVFTSMLYYVQGKTLFDSGFLAPLEYYSFDSVDRGRLELNAAGTDFTAESLRDFYQSINMVGRIVKYTRMILSERKNCLVFCSSVEDAYKISRQIPGSAVLTGDTDQDKRDEIIKAFTSFRIRCLINVKVLDTGFDFPGLEAVLMGFSTMSLASYYQILGRVMRLHFYPNGSKKVGWFVDLGGNINFFGKVETMTIEQDAQGDYLLSNVVNGIRRRLTNVSFSKN